MLQECAHRCLQRPTRRRSVAQSQTHTISSRLGAARGIGGASNSARRQNMRDILGCSDTGSRPACSGPNGMSELCIECRIARSPSGCACHCAALFYRVARCVRTSTQRQLRHYGGGVFASPRRVPLLTVLGRFYWSVLRKSWCLFPLVVLAQRTVVEPQTGALCSRAGKPEPCVPRADTTGDFPQGLFVHCSWQSRT